MRLCHFFKHLFRQTHLRCIQKAFLMIANNLKSKHEDKFTDEYVVPEVWVTTVKIGDLRTEELNGKKFTTYGLEVEVRSLSIYSFCLKLTH
jgi:hypothetical protein